MKFSIRTKVILGFLLIIAFMTFIIVGVHFSNNRQIKSAQTIAEDHQQAEELYMRLLVEIRNEEIVLNDYLVSKKEHRWAVFEQAKNRTERDFAALKRLLTKYPGCANIIRLIQPALSYLNDVATKTKNHDIMPGKQSTFEFGSKVNSLFRNQASIIDILQSDHLKADALYKVLTARAYQTTLFLTLLLAVIAGTVGFFIAGSITSPLAMLMKGIEKGSEGDFQLIQNVKTNDEVKELVTAFNQMITAIQTKEADLRHKNQELLAQGQELSAQNEEILAQQDELEQALGTLSTQEELLGRLYRFSQTLTQTIETTDFAPLALRGILDEADAEVGVFYLYDQRLQELKPQAAIGLSKPQNCGAAPSGGGLAGKVAAQKRIVVAAYHEGQLKTQSLRGEIAMASEIYLPLIFHQELLGVIALGRTGKKEFTSEEQKLLTSLSDQICIALRNSLTHSEIREALQRIQEVDKLKSELINTVSHELRTPLSSILGFAELLLKKQPGEAKAQKYLTTIYHESVRLTGLINNFLDLQRIENGRLEFTKKPVDLTEVVRNSVETYRGQSPLHTISLNLASALPQVLTDPDRVTQVLGNLLSNAVKYSPEGGLVTVRAFLHSPAELEVSVADHGLGIPRDAIAHIFRPFFRVDNSDRRQIGGTGLGLAICQRIIEALGGRIWVESEHGRGSTFAFTLPLAVATAHHDKGALKEIAVAGEDYILVVEDDPAMANLICETLNGAGYATKLTDNGPDALEIVTDYPPNAVILDLILPGPMDGWEVLRRFKMNGRTREVPVIISSCLDQREYGFERGVADYLIKPFSPDKLLSSLAAIARIAGGVIGLPGPDHPAVKKSVAGLLNDKGFAVQEVKSEADLLLVTLKHPGDTEKGEVQHETD